MSIIGNPIGSISGKVNYNQTDTSAVDYLPGKDKLDAAIADAKKAGTDAASTAKEAKTAAGTAQDTANSAAKTANAALPKAGGAMTGAVTMKGIILTSGVDYGDSLPSTVTAGKLFFKKVT